MFTNWMIWWHGMGTTTLFKWHDKVSFIIIPKEKLYSYWSSIPPRKLMEQPMLYSLTWVWIECGLVHFVLRGGVEIHTDRSIDSGGEFERVLVGTLQCTTQTFRIGPNKRLSGTVSTCTSQRVHIHDMSMLAFVWHFKAAISNVGPPHFVLINLCCDWVSWFSCQTNTWNTLYQKRFLSKVGRNKSCWFQL